MIKSKTVAKEKLPGSTSDRNPKRTQTQKGTRPRLGDVGSVLIVT